GGTRGKRHGNARQDDHAALHCRAAGHDPPPDTSRMSRSYRANWWKCGGGDWGRKTHLSQSTPPPHTTPRGGIDAAQMTPKRQIAGDNGSKREAQQQEGLLPASFSLGGPVDEAGRFDRKCSVAAGRRGLGQNRFAGEGRQGYG